MPRTVIVGGVAGGASCAARLRRLDEQREIVLLERGPHVSFANCGLPYYVGDVIANRKSLLVSNPQSLRSQFRLDVRIRHEVVSIDPAGKLLQVRDLDADRLFELAYDELLLSPGAQPLIPPLPGIDSPGVFTLRSVPDSDQIRDWIVDHQAQRAVVVGGGFIGVEMAENLRHRGLAVDLLEMLDQLMPPLDPEVAFPLQQALQGAGIKLHLGDGLQSIQQDGSGLAVHTGSGQVLDCDLVILAIGVRPESQLAQDAGLACGPRGHIIVDLQMRSSDPAIFAVGDAVQVQERLGGRATALPLAGPANRQGRLVADVICGKERRFAGVQGTAIVGAYDCVAACTGWSEKSLRAAGDSDYAVVRIHRGHHVGYYPGAQGMSLKLLYRPSDGRILGAQAVGGAGVDRRIDSIAVALQMGASVDDLAESELCYAPQFGAAKDVVNIAAMVAQNQREGLAHSVEWTDLPKDAFLLDVRDAQSAQADGLAQATCIPLGELRTRIAEVPPERPVCILCNVGQSAWNAQRILRQQGLDAYIISGGMRSYHQLRGAGLIRSF